MVGSTPPGWKWVLRRKHLPRSRQYPLEQGVHVASSTPGGPGHRPGVRVLLHRRHQQDQGQHRRLHHADRSGVQSTKKQKRQKELSTKGHCSRYVPARGRTAPERDPPGSARPDPYSCKEPHPRHWHSLAKRTETAAEEISSTAPGLRARTPASRVVIFPSAFPTLGVRSRTPSNPSSSFVCLRGERVRQGTGSHQDLSRFWSF